MYFRNLHDFLKKITRKENLKHGNSGGSILAQCLTVRPGPAALAASVSPRPRRLVCTRVTVTTAAAGVGGTGSPVAYT
jgi:hypothetical protein